MVKEFWAAFQDPAFMTAMEGGEVGAGEQPPQPVTSAKQLAAPKGKTEVEDGWVQWWKPAGAGLVMVFCITAVELVIRWNRIENVNSILSTGQLIPFVIGLGGLGKILFRWWQLEKERRGKMGEMGNEKRKGKGGA